MLISHTNQDITGALLLALHEMKITGDKLLFFEPGCYHFYPNYALERVSCISNHDNDGFKKIGIPLIDFDGLTVEGNGAEFIFHHVMVPVEVENCKNITLRNFSIDSAVPQYAHATVLESTSGQLRLKLWDNAIFQVAHQQLQFSLDGKTFYNADFFLDIDPGTDMVTEGTYRIPCVDTYAEIDTADARIVTLHGELIHTPARGDTLCIHFGKRWACGFFIHDSAEVILENVTIHSCLGIGVLAQLCRDITLQDLRITPSEGRYMSAPADGCQFINCSGQITLENCLMEKHFDDCLNCHGIYMQINRILDSHQVLARLVHHQQLGVPLFKPGESVEFINHETLLPRCRNRIVSFESFSRSLAIIRFEEPVDPSIQPLDCLESLDACPDLTVQNCQFQKAFPRGLLITTRGHVLVENNYFRTTASAIHISGDCNSWFESGCVRDVTIRNNTFDHCGIAKDSRRTANYNVINIVPEIPTPDSAKGFFHHNIRITNNRFICAHSHVLKAISTQGLIFQDNLIDIPDPIVTAVE